MPITLDRDIHEEATAAVQSYLQDELDVSIGNLGAMAFVDFIVAEIGPSLYNRGVRDVQERLHAQIVDLDVNVSEAEFPSGRRLRR